MSEEFRMFFFVFLEDDVFFEMKNIDGKEIWSKDDIFCLGYDEFGVFVEYLSIGLDILFWNGE